METLAETIHLLTPANYINVFLAHGLGTLIGAFLAAKIATTRKMVFVFVIGAYIPMAWIG